MFTRCVVLGVVLIACGKSEGPRPQGVVAPAPVAQQPPPPPGLEPLSPNAPKDKPVTTSTQAEMDAMERAIAPYSEQDRRLYPDAKRRYLAGLPPGHQFFVVTKLHSPGYQETVFVAVRSIEGDRITGRIASDIRNVTGYKAGDLYTFSESELVDWVITRPDGSEEGNLVGKFIDTWNPAQHH